MNFQTILEELDRLYEELPAKEATKKEIDEVEESEVVEACDKKSLTEEADDEEIEIVDDEDEAPEEEPEEEVEEPEVEEEEARQLILECDNCGALVIRAEADVKVDEETDLANVGDVCAFCEESVGSKIVGVVAPYEEALEEGIFNKKSAMVTRETIDATEVKKDDILAFDEECQETSKVVKVELNCNEQGDTMLYLRGRNNMIIPKGQKVGIVVKEDLEEGIFDKKPNAEFNNTHRQFETKVKSLTGKTLAELPFEIDSILRGALSELKVILDKEMKQTDPKSKADIYASRSKVILDIYAETLKALKKPTNFGALTSIIRRALNKIFSKHASESWRAIDTINELHGAVSKISSIELDNEKYGKKVKQEALKKFFESTYKAIDQTYQKLRKKRSLFEAFEEESEEELTELFGLGKKKSKEPEIERVPYLGMKHTSGAFAKEICQKVQKEIGGKVVRAGANECFWLADNAKQFDLGNKLMHDLVRSSRMPNTSIVTEAFDEHEGEELEELLDFDVDLPISVNADGNSVAVGGVA
jgi:hypothetical protein